MSCLGESIANPPISVDAPSLLRVIVKQSIRPHLRNERLAVGLNIVLFVSGAADDLGRLSVPHPVHLEARLRLRQHGIIQLGLLPGSAFIRADFNLRYLAMAAPGQTRNAVIAGAYLHHSRWRCDDGIRLHPELELHGLAVAQDW